MLFGLVAGALVILGTFSLFTMGPSAGDANSSQNPPAQEQQVQARFDYSKPSYSAPNYSELAVQKASAPVVSKVVAETPAAPLVETPRVVAAVVAPVPEPAPKAIESPAAKAVQVSAADAWGVQVGSLKSRADADRKLSDVQSRGFTGFIEEAPVNGVTVYRVKLGPFPTKAEASATQKLAIQNPDMAGAFVGRLPAQGR